MNPLLTCDAFSYEIQDKKYSSSGFCLNKGEIIHLFAESEFSSQDFLFLISGLHTARNLTKPGEDNNLERQPIEINLEELSFIKLEGIELYKIPKKERAQKISFIYENPDIAIFGRTVRDDFFYSFSLINKTPHSTDLIRYGLYEIIDRKTEVISGGEKHRLICANAFERKPKLIIADFSSSNLDKDFLTAFLKWLNEYVLLGGSAILHGLSPEEIKLIGHGVKELYGDKNGIITDSPYDSQIFLPDDIVGKKLKDNLLYRVIGDNLLDVIDVYVENRTKPISFELKENEIVIIEGNNGCGKTTLGRILTGKIKKYNGKLIKSKKKIRPGISLQFPERSFIHWKIWNELPVNKLLTLCGIDESLWQSHPRNLCRAKQKLLSIACALYYSKSLTILDEPTTGLDYKSKIAFIKLLNSFQNQAIIIFNHDKAISGLCRTIKYI